MEYDAEQVRVDGALSRRGLLELRANITWANAAGKAGVRFVDVPQSSQYQLEKWLTDRMHSELPSELQQHLKVD